MDTETERFRSHRLSSRGAYLWETPSRNLKFDEQYDVTHPVNLRRVLRVIADGGVLDCMMSVPSIGSNVTRDCSRPFRSSAQTCLVLTQGIVSYGQWSSWRDSVSASMIRDRSRIQTNLCVGRHHSCRHSQRYVMYTNWLSTSLLLTPNDENVQLFWSVMCTRLTCGLLTSYAVVNTNNALLRMKNTCKSLKIIPLINTHDPVKLTIRLETLFFRLHPLRPNAEIMLWFKHATGEMTRPAVQSLLCAESYLWHQDCLAIQTQRPCQVMRHNFWKSTSAECRGGYLYKNDTSLRVYQIALLLILRTTMTGTYSSTIPKKLEGKLVLNDVCKLFMSIQAVSVLVSVFTSVGHKFFTSDPAEKFGLFKNVIWTVFLDDWNVTNFIPCDVSLYQCFCLFLLILMFASLMSGAARDDDQSP